MTLKDEFSRLLSAPYATGEEWEISPGRMKRLSQSENNAQLWMWLVIEVKSNADNNNYAKEPGMLGPWDKLEVVK